MEQSLIQRLLSNSGLSALVSNRVHPGSRPQGSALPAIVLNRISGGPGYADDGETGLTNARIQIDCWAATYRQAKLVARAVTASLSDFQGNMTVGENLDLVDLPPFIT
jgi:hypothetical protein